MLKKSRVESSLLSFSQEQAVEYLKSQNLVEDFEQDRLSFDELLNCILKYDPRLKNLGALLSNEHLFERLFSCLTDTDIKRLLQLVKYTPYESNLIFENKWLVLRLFSTFFDCADIFKTMYESLARDTYTFVFRDCDSIYDYATCKLDEINLTQYEKTSYLACIETHKFFLTQTQFTDSEVQKIYEELNKDFDKFCSLHSLIKYSLIDSYSIETVLQSLTSANKKSIFNI